MDEGRVVGTTEIWDATKIRQAVEVENVDWRCPGCHARVHPAAWRNTGGEKVTAYLKRHPGQQHDDRCRGEKADLGPDWRAA